LDKSELRIGAFVSFGAVAGVRARLSGDGAAGQTISIGRSGVVVWVKWWVLGAR